MICHAPCYSCIEIASSSRVQWSSGEASRAVNSKANKAEMRGRLSTCDEEDVLGGKSVIQNLISGCLQMAIQQSRFQSGWVNDDFD